LAFGSNCRNEEILMSIFGFELCRG